MANAFQSGSIYIDTTGSLTSKAVKVAYVIFTPNAANDQIILRDGTTGSDPVKLAIKHATAQDSKILDFSRRPLTFNAGVYVTVPTSGTATLILTSEGSTT